MESILPYIFIYVGICIVMGTSITKPLFQIRRDIEKEKYKLKEYKRRHKKRRTRIEE